jgi:hypothetical protein
VNVGSQYLFVARLVCAFVGIVSLPLAAHGELVSAWSFDESAAGTSPALDTVNGNNGTFEQTATRTFGLVGVGAALFNNVPGSVATNSAGDGVFIGTGVGMAPTTAVTIEALVQCNWNPDLHLVPGFPSYPDYDTIFRREDPSATDDRMLLAFQNDAYGYAASPAVPPGPVLSFGLMVGGVYSELDMPLDGIDGRPTVAQITTGTHHIAATYDSATGDKSIYIDGVRTYFTSESGLITLTTTGFSSIGENPALGIEPFTGVIDEVGFYNSALSPSEVLAHYNLATAGQSYLPEPHSVALCLAAATLLARRMRR